MREPVTRRATIFGGLGAILLFGLWGLYVGILANALHVNTAFLSDEWAGPLPAHSALLIVSAIGFGVFLFACAQKAWELCR